MGCDIHMNIECVNKNRSKLYHWWSFATNLTPLRDYQLFATLAGVRGHHHLSRKPKGLVGDISSGVRDEVLIKIVDKKEYEEVYKPSFCTIETAKEWERRGLSEIYYDAYGNPSHAYNPDWHTYSRMTYREFAKALVDNTLISHNQPSAEYKAILSCMEKLEEDFDTRIVFWFDN